MDHSFWIHLFADGHEKATIRHGKVCVCVCVYTFIYIYAPCGLRCQKYFEGYITFQETNSHCLSYCHQMSFMEAGDSQIFYLVLAFEGTKTRHFLNNAASAIS